MRPGRTLWGRMVSCARPRGYPANRRPAAGLAALCALGTLCAPGTLCAQAPPPEPIFQAMRDEIDRARKLSLPNLEAPYFVEYMIDEQETFSVTANLGGLLTRRKERFRSPDVQIRVGDYKFDNSNFAAFGGGSRYDLERFPLEDSYPLLPRYFWLMADSAYKSSREAISCQRAGMSNMQPDG